MSDWDRDSVHWKVRVNSNILSTDWRGLEAPRPWWRLVLGWLRSFPRPRRPFF